MDIVDQMAYLRYHGRITWCTLQSVSDWEVVKLFPKLITFTVAFLAAFKNTHQCQHFGDQLVQILILLIKLSKFGLAPRPLHTWLINQQTGEKFIPPPFVFCIFVFLYF